MKDRIRRLEGPRRPERCPECGDRILFEERHADGTVTYPGGEPCEARGSTPVDGSIGIIEVTDAGGDVPDASDGAGVVVWP